MTPATILENDGIKQPITEWALDYGITPAIIIARLERGETVAEAITKPMKVGHRGQRLPAIRRRPQRATNSDQVGSTSTTFTYSERTLTVAEWARLTGLTSGTLGARLRSGWSIDRALTTPPDKKRGRRGVSSNFAPSEGTGAGSTLQETPKITFSENA